MAVKAINTLRPSSKGHQYLSDEGLTLETSAFKLLDYLWRSNKSGLEKA